MQSSKELSSHYIHQSYSSIKAKLMNPESFPKTNKILNLPYFVKDNYKMYCQLLQELSQLKANLSNTRVQSNSQSRVKSVNNNKIPMLSKSRASPTECQHLSELLKRNQFLKRQIRSMREENITRQIRQTPLLTQKQKEIQEKSQQIQKLTQESIRLKEAIKTRQVFDLYQKMCRECQVLRQANNLRSEELKQSIAQLNKLTGRQENANIFLTNLKI